MRTILITIIFATILILKISFGLNSNLSLESESYHTFNMLEQQKYFKDNNQTVKLNTLSGKLYHNSPILMKCHIISAFVLFILAYFRCLCPRSRISKYLFPFVHMIFIVFLIPILSNLPWTCGTIMDVILGIGLHAAYIFGSPNHYFTLLSTPLLIEVIITLFNILKL